MRSARKLNWEMTIPSWAVNEITGLKNMDAWLQQPGDAMIALARAKQAGEEYAQQYRGVLVGACAARLMSKSYTIGQYVGANRKLAPDDTNDIHAEEPTLDASAAGGTETISALAVVGDVQPDDTSGAAAETLLPCARRCTRLILTSPMIVDRTLIVGATPDMRTVQYYDRSTLADVHSSGDASQLPTIRFESSDGLDQDEWIEKFYSPLYDRLLAHEA